MAQAAEADIKFNAKLDILARLQAARTPGRPVAAGGARHASLTPSTAYDDSDEDEEDDEERGSDEEEGEEDEAGRDDSEEVRGMLLPAGDASLAESSVRAQPRLCYSLSSPTRRSRALTRARTTPNQTGLGLAPRRPRAARLDAVARPAFGLDGVARALAAGTRDA